MDSVVAQGGLQNSLFQTEAGNYQNLAAGLGRRLVRVAHPHIAMRSIVSFDRIKSIPWSNGHDFRLLVGNARGLVFDSL
jgi:hypothetical protein